MTMLHRIAIAVFFLCSVCLAQNDNKPNFPTDEEISLVVNQAERALAFYKISMELKMKFPSLKKQDVINDQQLIKTGDGIVKRLNEHPSEFHTIVGFLLISTLDDASRNAALCSAMGAIDIIDMLTNETARNAHKAEASEYLSAVESCQSASAQLYTVSENVHVLLLRELQGQQLLMTELNDTVDKCGVLVKEIQKKPH